jgi:hypothetical protein
VSAICPSCRYTAPDCVCARLAVPPLTEWTVEQFGRLWKAMWSVESAPESMDGQAIYRRWSETHGGALYMPGPVGRHRKDEEAVA